MGRRNRKRRSPEERQLRQLHRWQRYVVLPLRGVILLAFGVGVGLGTFQLIKLVRTSPMLSVRTIDVQGAKRTKVETILRESGLKVGTNIFAVDLESAERRVRELPWVREASVVRDVPDRLLVKIEEYEPVAAILLGGLYYLDRNATVFKRVQPNETVDLPVLTGISRQHYTEQPEQATRRILGSLQLLERFHRDECLNKMDVSEIHHDPLLGFTAVLDPGALSVRLGKTQVEQKLPKLCNLLAEISSQNLKPHTILLDQEDRPGWATVSVDARPSILLAGNEEEPKDEVSHGEKQ